MLSIIRHNERITVRLTGRLEGSSAEDLRLAICPPSALDIDLGGVTSIDHNSERTLVWVRDDGATLRGEGLFVSTLSERMQLSPSVYGEEGTLNDKAVDHAAWITGIGESAEQV